MDKINTFFETHKVREFLTSLSEREAIKFAETFVYEKRSLPTYKDLEIAFHLSPFIYGPCLKNSIITFIGDNQERSAVENESLSYLIPRRIYFNDTFKRDILINVLKDTLEFIEKGTRPITLSSYVLLPFDNTPQNDVDSITVNIKLPLKPDLLYAKWLGRKNGFEDWVGTTNLVLNLIGA